MKTKAISREECNRRAERFSISPLPKDYHLAFRKAYDHVPTA